MKEKVLVFGASNFARQMFNIICNKYDILYFLDNDNTKWGKKFNNITIIEPNELTKKELRSFKIIICSSFYMEICNQLIELGLIDNIFIPLNVLLERENYNKYLELEKVASIDEFNKYIEKINMPIYFYEHFKKYKQDYTSKLKDFELTLQQTNTNLINKTFLEIGPGNGYSLEIAKIHNAKKVEFVDKDPFFYTYNKLMGFADSWYLLDHLVQLNKLPDSYYDVIYTKGSFSIENFFIDNSNALLDYWIDTLEKKCKRKNRIIIIPHCGDTNGSGYIDKFMQTLCERNFKMLKRKKFLIEYDREFYPITFYK